MTKKRFKSEDDGCGYYTEIIDEQKELDLSIPNPKKNLTIEELINLLNELDEKYIDEFALRETLQQELQRVEEENKQLKQRNDFLKKQFDRVCAENETMGDKLKKIGRIL